MLIEVVHLIQESAGEGRVVYCLMPQTYVDALGVAREGPTPEALEALASLAGTRRIYQLGVCRYEVVERR